MNKSLNILARSVVAITVALLLTSCDTSLPSINTAPQNALESAHQEVTLDIEEATVVRVVDGDTLVIDRGQGDEKLRLTGINAPESVHPEAAKNTREGELASIHLNEMLSVGTKVWLQKDISDTDSRNRLLRYVWIEVPEDLFDGQEVEEKMLNAILIKSGFAVAKKYPPDVLYSTVFENLNS